MEVGKKKVGRGGVQFDVRLHQRQPTAELGRKKIPKKDAGKQKKGNPNSSIPVANNEAMVTVQREIRSREAERQGWIGLPDRKINGVENRLKLLRRKIRPGAGARVVKGEGWRGKSAN